MCGFAGEFLLSGALANEQLARAMADTLRHRGPDEAGSFISDDGRCAIGFRRLAVLDPPGSHQPMSSADGQITVVFNGEIYNFRQLRRQLQADGAVFRTAGDTEVLLHLYARYGRQMVHHLRGMFAFVLFDAARKKVLLARDRLGQKPLWYAVLPDKTIFASQLRALLAHNDVEKRIDNISINFYMSFGYIPAPRSIYQGICKLPPACTLCLEGTAARPEKYWHPASADLESPQEQVLERLRSELAEVVAAHMVSDVPLGALLSGGVDSSIVVALMARSGGRTGGVKTFTAGFTQREFDERPAAAAVAAHCGTDHTELLVEPQPGEALDQLVTMYDEPFADSSALPTWMICQAARRHVTVALVGDGGDEVFAGYDRYRAMHLGETLGPTGYLAVRLAAALARPFAPHRQRSSLRRFIRFADALPQPFAQQYFRYRRLFGPEDLPRLFSDDFAGQADTDAPAEWFCRLYEEGDFDSEVTRAQRHDMLTYLPDDLLVKTDIASMACSLELRAPLLDHEIVQLGLSLPPALKLNRRCGKLALRRAFADLLPKEAFQGPKRGFAVPLGQWLREDLRETLRQTLLDRSFLKAGIFRRESLAGLINDHLTRRDDHSHRLWALLVLARWLALGD